MIVRWTRPAADDLAHICDYTENRFGAAQAWSAALAIYEAADGLQDCQTVVGSAVSLARVKSWSLDFHS